MEKNNVYDMTVNCKQNIMKRKVSEIYNFIKYILINIILYYYQFYFWPFKNKNNFSYKYNESRRF